MSDKGTVRRYFNADAAGYDRFYSDGDLPRVYPFGRKRTDAVLERIGAQIGFPGRRMIDLGCGGGQLCVVAAEMGMEVVGVDFSAGMLAQARGRLMEDGAVAKRVRLVHAEILDNGLPDESADVVAALGVVEYLDEADMPAFFTEAVRLLRPGGQLIIETRNRLFNMASLNEYTQTEVSGGDAPRLLEEIAAALDARIDHGVLEAFVRRLRDSVPLLEKALEEDRRDREAGAESAAEAGIEAGEVAGEAAANPLRRLQHTPEGLSWLAGAAGLGAPEFMALHPHPLPPQLEAKGPRFYNCLAAAFEPLGRCRAGLAWSSSMLAVFTKGEGDGETLIHGRVPQE